MTNDNLGASESVSADLQAGNAPADDNANTVHEQLTKFAVGEEIKLQGQPAKVVGINADGTYQVAYGKIETFHEDDLTKL